MRAIYAHSLLIGTLVLTGCATVSETIPTIKVVRKSPAPLTTTLANYDNNNSSSVQQAEAPMVCDNANMRARAADNDPRNDSARVLILEDSDRSSTVLADVVINCRDYFQNSGRWAQTPQPSVGPSPFTAPILTAPIVTAPTQNNPVIKARSETVTLTSNRRYTIRTGDTLYRVARGYCTDAETLADINGIADASRITPGQVIRLPEGGC